MDTDKPHHHTTRACHPPEPHPDHSKEIARLNRIIGQLEGVRRMIEDRRYCPDILTQTRAAASALRGLEAEILREHLRSCVRTAFASSNEHDTEQHIDEILDLFRKAP